jgi:hypothetical protein
LKTILPDKAVIIITQKIADMGRICRIFSGLISFEEEQFILSAKGWGTAFCSHLGISAGSEETRFFVVFKYLIDFSWHLKGNRQIIKLQIKPNSS